MSTNNNTSVPTQGPPPKLMAKKAWDGLLSCGNKTCDGFNTVIAEAMTLHLIEKHDYYFTNRGPNKRSPDGPSPTPTIDDLDEKEEIVRVCKDAIKARTEKSG